MGNIFISYRRDDAAGEARALYNDLAAVLGHDRVFMDVDNIEPGIDFRDVLKQRLENCEVMLVLLGPLWLDMRDAGNARRLEQPHDFVRIEVGTALGRGVRVVPVLIRGAQLPPADRLPPELQPLVTRQKFSLNHDAWDAGVKDLIKRLKLQRSRKPLWAIGGAALLAAGGGAAWLSMQRDASTPVSVAAAPGAVTAAASAASAQASAPPPASSPQAASRPTSALEGPVAPSSAAASRASRQPVPAAAAAPSPSPTPAAEPALASDATRVAASDTTPSPPSAAAPAPAPAPARTPAPTPNPPPAQGRAPIPTPPSKAVAAAPTPAPALATAPTPAPAPTQALAAVTEPATSVRQLMENLIDRDPTKAAPALTELVARHAGTPEAVELALQALDTQWDSLRLVGQRSKLLGYLNATRLEQWTSAQRAIGTGWATAKRKAIADGSWVPREPTKTEFEKFAARMGV